MERQAPGLKILREILSALLHATACLEKGSPVKLQRMKTDTSSSFCVSWGATSMFFFNLGCHFHLPHQFGHNVT